MENNILERIQSIFRDVFDNEALMVGRSTNATDIEEWDSLNNINLVVAIEKEFKVKFALSELVSLKNVGDMVDLIGKKIK
jgi:acyl carrier protein